MGDFIVFHKSMGTLKNNQVYKVSDIRHEKNEIALTTSKGTSWVSVKEATNATLFTENAIAVAKGDTLRWTRNHDDRINKNLVTVFEVNRHSIVVEDNISGKRESISTKDHCHLDYGLVMTVYSSQGHDRKHGIFLAESNVSMNTWYTALTRMKDSITVITDNKDKLIDRIYRSTTKINALDLMENKSGWVELRQENKKADLAPKIELNRDGPELGN